MILLDKKKSVVLFSFDMVHLLSYQKEKFSLFSWKGGKTAYYNVILVTSFIMLYSVKITPSLNRYVHTPVSLKKYIYM